MSEHGETSKKMHCSNGIRRQGSREYRTSHTQGDSYRQKDLSGASQHSAILSFEYILVVPFNIFFTRFVL